ncbi:MAG: hypothetical protein D3923_04015 [Candidatus Electrothrix sp. AR3]|nr:hypothetical protein [Candidatus Electrothrix sp. AR3]
MPLRLSWADGLNPCACPLFRCGIRLHNAVGVAVGAIGGRPKIKQGRHTGLHPTEDMFLFSRPKDMKEIIINGPGKVRSAGLHPAVGGIGC